MQTPPPRRTRERILDVALRLFNAFGEPNVNTTQIAEEMHISPGNLYYHFRNKDDIVLSVFEAFEREIDRVLEAPVGQRANIEDAWLFLHVLFELIWKYRFFYRDLNNLLTNNRTLELRFKDLLARKAVVARRLCAGLASGGDLQASEVDQDALAHNMVVVATYWLSYEYVLAPRRQNDAHAASAALARGCFQVMMLAAPYLSGEARALFDRLAAAYRSAPESDGRSERP